MRRLQFWSRLVFICNLFFVISMLVQRWAGGQNNTVSSTVFIIGYFLALIINPVVNLVYAVKLIGGRGEGLVPFWLPLANFVFLLLQLQFIFFLNDTEYR